MIGSWQKIEIFGLNRQQFLRSGPSAHRPGPPPPSLRLLGTSLRTQGRGRLTETGPSRRLDPATRVGRVHTFERPSGVSYRFESDFRLVKTLWVRSEGFSPLSVPPVSDEVRGDTSKW